MNDRSARKHGASAWWTAALALSRHLGARGSTEGVAEAVLAEGGAAGRGRAEWLLRGALRDYLAIEGILRARVRRDPQPTVWAALVLAGYEMRERGVEKRAAVVDFAVGEVAARVGRSAASFVNAVLRRVAGDPALDADADAWARAAHPAWLVQSWERRWGRETVASLLRWNQTPAPTYVWMPQRCRDGAVPAGCAAAPWPGFFRLEANGWPAVRPLLDEGRGYIRDPMTQPVVDLPNVRAGMAVLDLCAAPGGKTVGWMDRLADAGGGRVFAVDLPGDRTERLRANLARADAAGVSVEVQAGDILEWARGGALPPVGWPTVFDLVVIDAPCSNTGVLRRRPDAKIRLRQMGARTVGDMVALQDKLLRVAAEQVRPGGQLLYATCSLEEAENAAMVRRFCASQASFRLEREQMSYPWVDNHDGGGAFLLTRSAGSN
ncbi:MAG: RsmB/NOP family class I SAM-dependent RNA methyltransferase [Opitutales bacterium]|nr:RsmB/NOP family class I SAM-dependent RNA methyltransferase [Opitutales bacterium]